MQKEVVRYFGEEGMMHLLGYMDLLRVFDVDPKERYTGKSKHDPKKAEYKEGVQALYNE